jgi:LysM repeat protein
MNNQSPLIPQGSLLEQKNKTRVRVKIAVIFVLAIHGIGLLALLMQGCGHENAGGPGAGAAPSNSNTAGLQEPAAASQAPSFAAPSNAAPERTSTTAVATSPPPASMAETNVQPPAPLPQQTPGLGPSVPQAGVGEYKVVKGDTLSKIAKKSHVSLQALMAANPGVESRKLKIDQTIHVPQQTTVAAATTGGAPEGPAGQQVYTVKSNDSLTKIARQFGIKVKALRAANLLKTDKIKVGQKLNIPAKTAANAETAPAATGPSSNAPSPSGP